MKVFKNFGTACSAAWRYVRETFHRVTPGEIWGAAKETWKDLWTSRREVATLIAIIIALPLGSVFYGCYRLRLHRARIGKIDAAPEPLLTDARVDAIMAVPGKLSGAFMRAARRLPAFGLQGAGGALVLASAAVSTQATYQAFSHPFKPDYAFLETCRNTPRGQNLPAGCAPLLAHQRETFNTFGRAAGGLMVGVPAGVGMIAVGRRRKAAGAPEKAAGKT